MPIYAAGRWELVSGEQKGGQAELVKQMTEGDKEQSVETGEAAEVCCSCRKRSPVVVNQTCNETVRKGSTTGTEVPKRGGEVRSEVCKERRTGEAK